MLKTDILYLAYGTRIGKKEAEKAGKKLTNLAEFCAVGPQ